MLSHRHEVAELAVIAPSSRLDILSFMRCDTICTQDSECSILVAVTVHSFYSLTYHLLNDAVLITKSGVQQHTNQPSGRSVNAEAFVMKLGRTPQNLL